MPPKKFKEPNSKSVAAKERKVALKREEEERKKKEEEDKFWRDDDKHVIRKQARKMEKEKHRQEQLDKRQESKKLLEIEESSLKGKATTSSCKVTQSDIAQSKLKLAKSSGATPLPRGVVEAEPLTENPNLIQEKRKVEGYYDADTIDDAITILSVHKGQPEHHVERRMKAAYMTFEDKHLPLIKAQNPNLRLSQIKQLIRKEWMKSSENPMNQHHVQYNDI